MSGQVSGGSPIEYQADEQAGVTRLSWRLANAVRLDKEVIDIQIGRKK